jgi:hypothetical protein
MKWLSAFVFALTISWSTGSYSQDGTPAPVPTARDLYVGCFLFVNLDGDLRDESGRASPYSMQVCAATGMRAMLREGASAPAPNRFCLPQTASIRSNPGREMALAYLEYFEEHASRLADQHGPSVFLSAMINRWPC